GNGALVAALRTALDREPDIIVGKPEPALFTTAAQRVGSLRPLVIGDRLDTDIEGAGRADMDSLLVLTGVSTAQDLLLAPPQRRPTYVAADLSGLFEVDGVVRLDGDGAQPRQTGWTLVGDPPQLTGDGTLLEALAVLCATAWARPGVRIAAGSDRACAALRELALPGS
ncbi:MAG TPA: HAD hydrolase-like protein, partial [Micromonosporaceae bacterium]